MKTRILVLTVLVLGFVLSGALYAQETDPPAVVSAAIDAWNAGDVEGLKALFADDAVVCFPDFDETCTTGAEEIGAWIEGLVALNFAIEAESLEVEGDTVTVVAKVWADPTRGLGIAPLVTTDVYTVQDGQITSQTSTLTEESAAKLMAAMAPESMPETGGDAFPTYALVVVLGVLIGAGSLGMEMLRRRSHQH